MKELKLKKNVFNIQQCLMGNTKFLSENHGKFVLVKTQKCCYLCKVGLCDTKLLHDCIYVDKSVVIPATPPDLKHRHTSNHEFSVDDLEVLAEPQVATTMKITVIFQQVEHMQWTLWSKILLPVLKDLLKLYTFTESSYIYLDNLSESQNMNIHCIRVEQARGRLENGKLFKINSSTDIVVLKCKSLKMFEQEKNDSVKVPLPGCMKVYEQLKEIVIFNDNPKYKSRSILLDGLAGSGKTTLVEIVAQDLGEVLLELKMLDIHQAMPGDTENKLKEFFDTAKMHVEIGERCIVLVNKIDDLMVGSEGPSHTKRAVRRMISLMEDLKNVNGATVVGTCCSSDNSDETNRALSCFESVLEVMLPAERERLGIMEHLLQQYGVKCPEEVMAMVARCTAGFVVGDLQMLILDAVQHSHKTGSVRDDEVLGASFTAALASCVPSSLRGSLGLVKETALTLSDLGGLGGVKAALDLAVRLPLERPEALARLGVPPTKGVLLYGPPGCAKTSLVRALARETSTTFLAISAADLYSPYLGDAERCILQLFDQARKGAPTIVFIDEIDALVGSKGGSRERGVQERVLSALLVEMDGVGVRKSSGSTGREIIVVGATNRPDMLDDALKRPGRFDKLIYVPAPDPSERLNILRNLCRKSPLDASVDLERIAASTDYFSGADLKNVILEASLHLLTTVGVDFQGIRQTDFEHVLRNYQPSLNAKMIEFYERFRSRY